MNKYDIDSVGRTFDSVNLQYEQKSVPQTFEAAQQYDCIPTQYCSTYYIDVLIINLTLILFFVTVFFCKLIAYLSKTPLFAMAIAIVTVESIISFIGLICEMVLFVHSFVRIEWAFCSLSQSTHCIFHTRTFWYAMREKTKPDWTQIRRRYNMFKSFESISNHSKSCFVCVFVYHFFCFDGVGNFLLDNVTHAIVMELMMCVAIVCHPKKKKKDITTD